MQTATSGKEVRIANWSSPIWKFSLTFDHLRAREVYSVIGQVPSFAAMINSSQIIANDYYALAGFINGRQGMWDTWLYDDDSDNWIGQVQIGLGTGASINLQAVRQIGEYSENVQNLNGTPVGTIGTWSASLPVSSGGLVLPTLNAIRTQAGFVLGWQTPGWPNYFKCTTAGTTGSAEPNWRNAPISGATIQDGSCVWTNQGVPLVLFYNLTLADWAATTVYSAGTAIIPTSNNAAGYTYQCTTAGTSGASRPTFPQSLGATVTDGGAVWTCIGLSFVGAGGNLVPQLTSAYQVGNAGPGLITCSPPNNAQTFLTSGFYFRCRFSSDAAADFSEIMSDIWQLKELKFQSVKS